jgi:adenylate cyclase class IV
VKRNIELKARLANLALAHDVAQSLGAQLHDSEGQRDTYFPVVAGRLKLRQRWAGNPAQALDASADHVEGRTRTGQLIWYHRTDEARARPSDYSLVEVPDAGTLHALLAGALGVVVEVTKLRAIYLFNNVRIHLDQVAALGTFLEFEAIVDRECDEQAAEAKIRTLRAAFQLTDESLLSQGYSDLIRESGFRLQGNVEAPTKELSIPFLGKARGPLL